MKSYRFTRLLRMSWLAALVPAAAFAGCSEDSPAGPGTGDSGAEAAVPDAAGPIDSGAPSIDCASDLDEDNVPKHLSCTGLYESILEKKTGAEVKAFTPGLEFWSDGAEKHRWVFLPAGAKIDISDWDEWVYPFGMKVWKEFKQGGKRIETRLFMKVSADTWAHAVYRWNADETDAVRKEEGEEVPGIGPDGGVYEVPDSNKCEQCHFGRKDRMLGFEAIGLGLATTQGVTIASLAADGRFGSTPPATSFTFPGGTIPDKARPAIGWLHTNCGMCHNRNSEAAAAFTKIHFRVKPSQLAPPDGGAPAVLEDLDVWNEGYCKDSTQPDEDAGTGVAFKFIRGGDPARSVVSYLSGRRAPAGSQPSTATQMPPIVTRAVDHAGHKLLDDWILALPPCP